VTWSPNCRPEQSRARHPPRDRAGRASPGPPHRLRPGSASGLFNTATHLGIALGTTLTALVSFSATAGSPDGAINRAAFTGALWWVCGTLALMWALMFFLPEQASRPA
jgi:hypothetical protein